MNSTKRNVGLLAACQALLFTNNSTLIAINGLAGLALAPYVGPRDPAGDLLGARRRHRHHAGVAAHEARRPPARPDQRDAVGNRRRADLRGGDLGAELLAAVLRHPGVRRLQRLRPVLPLRRGRRRERRTSRRPRSRWCSPAAWSAASSGRPAAAGPSTCSRRSSWAAYLVLIGFALLTMVLLRFVRIPTPSAAEQSATGRPLREIAAQPKFIVAVLAGAIGYGVMNFLMTSTPIAMQVCGHPYGDAAFVISSHIIGMFAPSFVTGPLIKRVGVLPVMFVGALLQLRRHRASRSPASRWRSSGGRWCCSAWAGTSSTSAAPRCSPRPTAPRSAPRRRARTSRRSSS